MILLVKRNFSIEIVMAASVQDSAPEEFLSDRLKQVMRVLQAGLFPTPLEELVRGVDGKARATGRGAEQDSHDETGHGSRHH
jgi:hypothetical protein